MNEQLAVLELAVSRLEALEIRYFITGSIALAVYATPRMTRDIDIVIECDTTQAAALAKSFESDSYASVDAAREAASRKGMFNIVHNESLMKVDFIVRPQDEFNVQRFGRRRQIDLGDFKAFFSSPEDLILAKLEWRRGTGSEQQTRDIRALLSVTDLDWTYLDRWSARLKVDRDLQEMRSE